MRAHIYLTHPIPNTRSDLQLYESGGPEGVVFCGKASNSFSTGHSLNPRKQYITRLRIGTSIARDRMPGYPALEKIFQAGTMPRPTTINITSSAGEPIGRIKCSFRAIRLPHLRLHHSQAALLQKCQRQAKATSFQQAETVLHRPPRRSRIRKSKRDDSSVATGGASARSAAIRAFVLV